MQAARSEVGKAFPDDAVSNSDSFRVKNCNGLRLGDIRGHDEISTDAYQPAVGCLFGIRRTPEFYLIGQQPGLRFLDSLEFLARRGDPPCLVHRTAGAAAELDFLQGVFH